MNWDKFATIGCVFLGTFLGAGIVLFTLWLFKPDAMEVKPLIINNEWGQVEVGRQEITSSGDPILMYRPMQNPAKGKAN